MTYKSVLHSFNTGRPYTTEGQKIHIEYEPNTNTIYFHDESRMVSGKFPSCYADMAPRRLQELVLMAYDNGLYQNTPLPPSGMARRPQD